MRPGGPSAPRRAVPGVLAWWPAASSGLGSGAGGAGARRGPWRRHRRLRCRWAAILWGHMGSGGLSAPRRGPTGARRRRHWSGITWPAARCRAGGAMTSRTSGSRRITSRRPVLASCGTAGPDHGTLPVEDYASNRHRGRSGHSGHRGAPRELGRCEGGGSKGGGTDVRRSLRLSAFPRNPYLRVHDSAAHSNLWISLGKVGSHGTSVTLGQERRSRGHSRRRGAHWSISTHLPDHEYWVQYAVRRSAL